MTAILGISAFYHDSSAALIIDGEVIAAAQEERFSRIKDDPSFPAQAVEYCLAEAGIRASDIDFVGFYEKPFLKFERLLETYLGFVPSGYRSFRRAIPLWIRQKLHIPREIRTGLLNEFRGRIIFTEHHQSHAASAFFPSSFGEAAIMTLDGVGEWATTCLGVGRGNQIELTQEIRFPHSLGLLYSAFTYYTGFRVNSGEYKVMGLAPYGEPKYKQLIIDHLIDLKDDGSFRLDMQYFNYCQGLTMTSKRFHDLFGGPPRSPDSPITQRDMNLAASIQSVIEKAMLRTANHLHSKTGLSNLCIAGGVALNCVGNGKLLQESPFERIWIQPAAGDAGGALGVAWMIWHQLLKKPRTPNATDHQRGSLLGPSYSDYAIAKILDQNEATYETCNSDEELCEKVAELIDDENVVAWFQGRMEFGPRALGARSILGDARSDKMQSIMNLKVKHRESFRPFAPLVLREYADQYFEMPPGQESPYMLLTAQVSDAIREEPSDDQPGLYGIEKLNQKRSSIPAVTHVDYSARVQTVDSERNPLLRLLIQKFYERTQCAVLINTSFNVRDEPIVRGPQEALNCFRMTDIDVLVIGRHLLTKKDQTQTVLPEDRARHLAQFPLD
ncbi:MAG: carbamoyltransferase [bacterium]|nr:carbamoyltransferase [bacterium]